MILSFPPNSSSNLTPAGQRDGNHATILMRATSFSYRSIILCSYAPINVMPPPSLVGGTWGRRWGFKTSIAQSPGVTSGIKYPPTLHPGGTLRAFENHGYVPVKQTV